MSEYLGELLSVSQAASLINQVMQQATPSILIEGEVASFKVSKGKWVFFDLKDEDSTINCFMPLSRLGFPLSDGLKIKVIGSPKLTDWGRFSLTINQLQPVGEGSINKIYIELKNKLQKEGLFEPAKKRNLPEIVEDIAVISSAQAAGWHDFQRIINDNAIPLKIKFANVGVQGLSAPDEIIKAIDFLNKNYPKTQAIVIIRGGGSADDLSAFNNEKLVRKIAESKIPTVVGVGHETDETLSGLVADVRAATPTHAAQIIGYNKSLIIEEMINYQSIVSGYFQRLTEEIGRLCSDFTYQTSSYFNQTHIKLRHLSNLLESYNPQSVLERGYAIVTDSQTNSAIKPTSLKVGDSVIIETANHKLNSKITNVQGK